MASEGKAMNHLQRTQEQKDIRAFLECAFEKFSQFNLTNYIDFNSNISSEMFVSIMTIFHERLPCAQFFFRQHKKFKQAQLEKQAIKQESNPEIKSKNSDSFNSPDVRRESNVTAIASPNLIRGYSPVLGRSG